MRTYSRRNSNSVMKRLCLKALTALLVLGIPVMIFLFSFSVKKVEVVGAKRYTQQQIREKLLQSRLDYNSVFLYMKYHYISKPKIPFIEKMDVEMKDRHHITVYVYEKMVTGCVYLMGEYLYFDKDGIVVESSSKKIEDVPEIKGLLFDQIILNQKLQIQNDDLYEDILSITKLIHQYELDVDSVNFDQNENITLICEGIEVILGKNDEYDVVLPDLKNILLEVEDTDLYEIDMRDYDKQKRYVIGKTRDSTD